MAAPAIPSYKQALHELSPTVIPRMVVSAVASAAVSVILLSSAKVVLFSAALSATATLIDALVRPYFANFTHSHIKAEAFIGDVICLAIAGGAVGILKSITAPALGVIAPRIINVYKILAFAILNFNEGPRVPKCYVY